MPIDERARQLFAYFKSYNYKVKESGEVIVFEGIYAADRGQAAAVTFYTFVGEWGVGGEWWRAWWCHRAGLTAWFCCLGHPQHPHTTTTQRRLPQNNPFTNRSNRITPPTSGMGSVALVLSILFPEIGNWWYGLTLVSPLSAVYYYQRGERAEEVSVARTERAYCVCVSGFRTWARNMQLRPQSWLSATGKAADHWPPTAQPRPLLYPPTAPSTNPHHAKTPSVTHQVRVKMVTSDDDKTTDIIVEADQEEIARMAKVGGGGGGWRRWWWAGARVWSNMLLVSLDFLLLLTADR